MSAIRRIGNKKIIGKTDVKLDINNECTRLIANCIIYYNTALLSNIYQEYKIQNRAEDCELIKRLSPVAWQHINLVGKYEFCMEKRIIDLQEVSQTVINIQKSIIELYKA